MQVDLRWQDPPANRAALEATLAGRAALGDLVILPEMLTTGFTMEAAAHAETMDGPSVSWLRRCARECRTTLCGSLVIREGERFFNRLIWAGPDGSLGTYDKRHLFRMAGEHEHYAAGTHREIFRIGDWRVCPLVCYDLRFPVWSRGVDEYDLLLYVANWPAARRSAWRALLPARAIENLCYVAGVNRVGQDGLGVRYAGDSSVHDYLGRAVAEAGDRAQVLSVTLDGEALLRYRAKFPAHLDADRFRVDV